MPRRRQQGERQKAIGWISKTTTLCVHLAFLYISLPLLRDYNGRYLISRFMEDVNKRRRAKFSFSFWTSIWFLGIRLKESPLAFDKRLKERKFIIKRCFRGRRRRGILKLPIDRADGGLMNKIKAMHRLQKYTFMFLCFSFVWKTTGWQKFVHVIIDNLPNKLFINLNIVKVHYLS